MTKSKHYHFCNEKKEQRLVIVGPIIGKRRACICEECVSVCAMIVLKEHEILKRKEI
jgi:ATP-dependent protease Clp ATPase subunit